MTPFLELGVFRKLKEPGEFHGVQVSFDTIEWDSGVDLDPEFVYSKCHGALVIVSATEKNQRVGRQSFAGGEPSTRSQAGKGLPAYEDRVAETMTKACHGKQRMRERHQAK